MDMRKSGSRVLWYECVGFGIIIVLCWLDEMTDLPRYIVGGGEHAPDVRDSVVATLVVLLVWLVVFQLTRRLLRRLHYLEGFLRVCAWCRKIGYNDEWLPVEKYFSEGLHIETTHSICPDCRKRLEEDTTRIVRKELDQREGSPPTPAPGKLAA